MNFFNIGDDNLFNANNIGTGLQGIIAGDDNTLAGNQVIVPTSFGTNFGWMGNDNGNVGVNPANLLTLNPFQILALQPSGNNIVASRSATAITPSSWVTATTALRTTSSLARATSVTTCTGSETTPT